MGKLKRHLEVTIENQLQYPGVIELYGMRSVGKTTLLEQVEKDHNNYNFVNCSSLNFREKFSLDADQTFEAATTGFDVIIFDEVQTLPNLYLLIKSYVDKNKEAKIIISGSRKVERDQLAGSDPLTGRINSRLNLLPFSLRELEETKFVNTIDLLFKANINELTKLSKSISNDQYDKYVIRGGMPFMQEVDRENQISRANSFLDLTFGKDYITENINIQNLINFTKMLTSYSSNIINFARFSKDFSLSIDTVKKYIQILNSLDIINLVYPARKNKIQEHRAQPKVFFTDTGIVSAIQKVNKINESQDSKGKFLETAVMNSIINTNNILNNPFEVKFWRDSHNEVDIIVEGKNDSVAIEVKTTRTPKSVNLRGLKKFREYNKTVKKSYITYDGDFVTEIEEDIIAIPYKLFC